MSQEVRVVAVKDLEPGMRVLPRRMQIWRVEINLGYRLFHQPHQGKTAQWGHIILFRRLDVDEEVSFIWSFPLSITTVDVLE